MHLPDKFSVQFHSVNPDPTYTISTLTLLFLDYIVHEIGGEKISGCPAHTPTPMTRYAKPTCVATQCLFGWSLDDIIAYAQEVKIVFVAVRVILS